MGIPYLIWSGSTMFEPSWRRTVSWPLVKLMLAGAAGYIAYGTRAKEYLESFRVATSKITIAFNSTRTDYFHLPSKSDTQRSDLLKKKLGLHDRQVVLYYGQLIERKGVDVLLKAYALLKKEYPTTALLIIGTGQEQINLQQLQQQLAVTDVIYLPNPKDEQMADYYFLSSIAVLPSREEVWGLVVNQALQCGVPMIVSDKVGSGPDLIVDGSTGFVFESDNESSLAQALQTFFTKSAKWLDMSEKAARHSMIAMPSQTALKIHQAIRKVV
jgi:glycosyltransferase involved in cell wall biosynthesis